MPRHGILFGHTHTLPTASSQHQQHNCKGPGLAAHPVLCDCSQAMGSLPLQWYLMVLISTDYGPAGPTLWCPLRKALRCACSFTFLSSTSRYSCGVSTAVALPYTAACMLATSLASSRPLKPSVIRAASVIMSGVTPSMWIWSGEAPWPRSIACSRPVGGSEAWQMPGGGGSCCADDPAPAAWPAAAQPRAPTSSQHGLNHSGCRDAGVVCWCPCLLSAAQQGMVDRRTASGHDNNAEM